MVQTFQWLGFIELFEPFVYVFILPFDKDSYRWFADININCRIVGCLRIVAQKHKSDFIKNINDGYATTSVGINLAILISVILALI